MDLQEYMSGSIRHIMTKAYLSLLTNPREARFAHRMQRTFELSEQRRQRVKEQTGVEVPPFLISSIATTCNLNCKGCYARKNGIAANRADEGKPTLTPEQWHAIFSEAAQLGINFSLLAGGEPLTRRDLLESISTIDDMIFPVFTNGTMLGATYLDFFEKHLNMVPIISLEGHQTGTDERRGKGVYERVMMAMDHLAERKLFFGTSITVTTENMQQVTSREFLDNVVGKGCKIIFYVEYVPFDETTAHLAFKDEHVQQMERRVDELREHYDGVIFLSFPGDEKALDGCLASGRGFFHIGPDGAAEPCPFSPFSDTNVATVGVMQALQSPLFRTIRAARALGWEHTGGCTLYEHRDEIEQMVRQLN